MELPWRARGSDRRSKERRDVSARGNGEGGKEEGLGRKACAESSTPDNIIARYHLRDASARPLRHVTLQTVDNEAIVAA